MSALGTRVASLELVYAPVRSQTAFEETLERFGTAIRLGLLEPGARLPPERELCTTLGISRSTLRQALTALVQSGHLKAIRGRTGGTFVAARPPVAREPSPERVANWREICDARLAVELGVAVLAAERADAAALTTLAALADAMERSAADFPAYRHADVRWHVGLAEATGSPRLVARMTEVQGEMSDLIALIAHPAEVLQASNLGHRRLLEAVARRDATRAAAVMAEHLRGTQHVLAGLLP